MKNTLFPSVNIYIFFNFQKLFQNAEKLYQRLHLRKEVCQVYFAIKNKKQDLQQAKTLILTGNKQANMKILININVKMIFGF